MTKIDQIEQEIRKLNRAELTAFRNWFHEYDADEWDRQTEEVFGLGDLISSQKKLLRRTKQAGQKNFETPCFSRFLGLLRAASGSCTGTGRQKFWTVKN